MSVFISRTGMLDPVKQALSRSACSIDHLWQDHAAVWQDLGWNPSQVRLWAGCLCDIQIGTDVSGVKTYRLSTNQQSEGLDLAEQLVALLEKAGRPLPLVQLVNKMPAGMVVTETMLRAAAGRDHRLKLRGPLINLA